MVFLLHEVIQSGKLGASKRITFKERGDWWLENVAKSQIKASTYQEYEAVLRNHVYPLIGSSSFAKVSRQSIKAIIAKKKLRVFAINHPQYPGACPGDILRRRGFRCSARQPRNADWQAHQGIERPTGRQACAEDHPVDAR
jgi:hypothetical protein